MEGEPGPAYFELAASCLAAGVLHQALARGTRDAEVWIRGSEFGCLLAILAACQKSRKRSCSVSSTKFSAVISILLGVAAIILPYLVGTLAVMILGAVMLASGIVALLYVNAVRKEGIPVSVVSPWVQVIAGVIILIWPGLALWIVAVILGGGLILSGITGLTALRDSGVVNPPVLRKIELWSSIVLGVLLIVLGGAGSAILLGVVLGIALISTGLQRWRLAA